MTTIFTIPAGETFQSFAQLNNILIVITDLNRYFLLYDVDAGTYSELEEIPIPLLDIQTVGSQFTSDSITDLDDAVGEINALLSQANTEGSKLGHTYVTFAYKLFDGSYVKHTYPIYLFLGRTGTAVWISDFDGAYLEGHPYKWASVLISKPDNFNNTTDVNEVRVYTGKIGFAYSFTTEQKAILSKYDGIIKSFNMFISNPITPYSIVSDRDMWEYIGLSPDPIYNFIYLPMFNATQDLYWDYNGQQYLFKAKVLDDKDIFNQVITFYKVKELNLDTLTGTTPASLETISLPADLLTQEVLPVDNFTHHIIWGNKNYNYNSRLHFGDVTTKFFKGFYPFKWEYDYSLASAETYVAKIYIKTDQGEKIVYKEFETPAMEDVGGDPYLYYSNILSYPDSRAYKIEFLRIVSGGSNDGVYFGATVPVAYSLIPHPFLNLSYYINPLGIDDFVDIENHESGDNYLVTLDVADTDVENGLLNDPNRVQVSRLDNALVYEATNSYQIGNDDETILGFGSVVEPLSDGQFGAFPLYVFTTAGIFVLQQGSGSILYSNVLPLNKEVCNNHLSITDIGGGVVYSTVKGLNILSGRQITEISQFLEGEPKEYLVNNETYQDYLGDVNFVNLLTELSTVDFKTYLENAIIGFDHVNNEIVVSNDSYSFSYVYNIESKMWHKISEVYTEFVKVIPKTYGYKAGKFYDLTDEEFDYIETLIQTRPIKLESLNIKAIERLILRGYFDVKDLTYSAVLLFGTIDSKSYVFLCGKSPRDDSTFQDILIKNSHVGFKYFILVYVGQIKDSSINFIEVSYAERWNNKLR